MDNNKIVDNLNFIKIYFRVFIYKIIIPEKARIIQKRDKNHRLRMKIGLGARIGSENLRRRVQNAHESVYGIQEHCSALQHFWSAKRHFKRAEFPSFGLWPSALWVTIRHTLFDLFAEG